MTNGQEAAFPKMVNLSMTCMHNGLNYLRLKRTGKAKWRVQCDYEDCPGSAWPTSGKTAQIAIDKWNAREQKHRGSKKEVGG